MGLGGQFGVPGQERLGRRGRLRGLEVTFWGWGAVWGPGGERLGMRGMVWVLQVAFWGWGAVWVLEVTF